MLRLPWFTRPERPGPASVRVEPLTQIRVSAVSIHESREVLEQNLASLATKASLGDTVNTVRVRSLVRASAHHACATAVLRTAVPMTDIVGRLEEARLGTGLPYELDTAFHGITPLYAAETDKDEPYDILAVTGLAGNAVGSWKAGSEGDVWLRDWLPEEFPGARILTYGSDTALIGSNSKMSIGDLSTQLLGAFNTFRDETKTSRRPFVAIAHSLGGLLIKDALVQSYKASIRLGRTDNAPTHELCRGIVFFGTPHRGLQHSALLELVAEQPNEELIKSLLLDKNSEPSAYLRLLAEDFAVFSNESLRLVSIFERRTSPTVAFDQGMPGRTGPEVLMVTKESATLSGHGGRAEEVPLDENHSGLVKYASRHKGSYLTVKGQIKSLVSKISAAETISHKRLASLIQRLDETKAAAFDSTDNQHDSYCHPHTRVDILQQIRDWAWQDSPGTPTLFWLKGMAGTGKSTISRTFAKQCSEQGASTISFFFKRNAGDRGKATSLFRTLAAQLARKMPDDIVPAMEPAFKDSDPCGKPLKHQFEQLLLPSLQALRKRAGSPVVIVIDALDESEGDDGMTVVINCLLRLRESVSDRVRVFVTSRPEWWILRSFAAAGINWQDAHQTRAHQFVLHEVPRDTIKKDILEYLTNALEDIRRQFISLSPALERDLAEWPGDEKLDKLLSMSIPLFIFAVTVCRFLQGGKRASHPGKKLDNLLSQHQKDTMTGQQRTGIELTANRGFVERQMKEIYMTVLEQVTVDDDCDDDEHDELLNLHHRVIGPLVLLEQPLSVQSFAHLLDEDDWADIDQALRNLTSVIDVPQEPSAPVKILHQSFRDFLTSSWSGGFQINAEATHARLSKGCLDLLSKSGGLRRNMCRLRDPAVLRTQVTQEMIDRSVASEAQYACLYWAHHCKKSGRRLRDEGQVHQFLRRYLLQWIEFMALRGRISDSLRITCDLLDSLEESLPDSIVNRQFSLANKRIIQVGKGSAQVGALLQDLRRFLLEFGDILALYPLQVYYSAMLFAPRRSIIRQLFKDVVLPQVEVSGQPDVEWDTCQQTFTGQFGDFCFSPDGRFLTLGATTEVRVLETTGWGLYVRYQTLPVDAEVLQVAFSHDGKLFAIRCLGGEISIFKLGDEGFVHRQTIDVDWCYSFSWVGFGIETALLVGSGWDSDKVIMKGVEVWAADAEQPEANMTHVQTLNSVADQDLVAPTRSIHREFMGARNGVVSMWRGHFGEKGIISIWRRSSAGLFTHEETLSGWYAVCTLSTDGRNLATVKDTRDTILLWTADADCQRWRVHHSITPSDSYIPLQVTFSHDGGLLLVRTVHPRLQIFQTSNGHVKQDIKGVTGEFACHPDRKLIAFKLEAMQTLQTLELEIDTCYPQQHVNLVDKDWRHGSAISYLHIVTPGMIYSVNEYEAGHLWSLHETQFRRERALASSNAKSAGNVAVWHAQMHEWSKMILVYSPKSDEPWQRLVHQSEIRHIDLSPDGKYAASVTADCGLHIWQIETGRCLKTIGTAESKLGSFKRYHGLTFSPKNKLLAVATFTGVVIFSVDSGRRILAHPHRTDPRPSHDPIFSPDESFLVAPVQSPDGRSDLSIIDLATGSEQYRLPVGPCEKETSLVTSFSPDGKLMAVNAEKVYVLKVGTWECIEASAGYVPDVKWSPDSTSLWSEFSDFHFLLRAPLSDSSLLPTPVNRSLWYDAASGWLVLGETKTVCLPPKFRPSAKYRPTVVVQDYAAVLGSEAGRVVCVRFLPGTRPGTPS